MAGDLTAALVKTPVQLAAAIDAGLVINTIYSGAGTTIYALVVNRDAVVHTCEAWSVAL